jgi:two-component system OmpR family sensor kinase
VRLTAAFALAMVLVLAGAAVFVSARLRTDLDEGIDTTLRARAGAVAAAQPPGGPPSAQGASLEVPDESFVQVLTPAGRILDAAGGARAPALRPAEARRAARAEVELQREVPGIDTVARVLARPLRGPDGPFVLAVGQSLGDRNEELQNVRTSFAVGGAIAIVLASGIGYLLASAGLAPVEAMRRRAAEVSLSRGERLPLPEARDEVRRLGETLNEMLDRLRRSFERERRFVADASHELRTPVAVIKTELEAALRTGDYGPDVRESLVAAVEECDRLAQLAEDLLVLARAAEGELPVRREALDVRPVLEGVRDRFVDRAARHGRRIRIDAGDGQVQADPLRLRQALGNLVDNALRHGAGDVVLSSRGEDGGVGLDVADAGAGFAPDVAERAFERFARGNEGRTGDGAGLGLAIVRAIAEAHGGRAAIVPGPGATVRVWLPDETPPASAR